MYSLFSRGEAPCTRVNFTRADLLGAQARGMLLLIPALAPLAAHLPLSAGRKERIVVHEVRSRRTAPTSRRVSRT